MGVYKYVTKIGMIIIYFVILMIILSFIGTLLTVPSTLANILGVIVIILTIYGSVLYFKILKKLDKEESEIN